MSLNALKTVLKAEMEADALLLQASKEAKKLLSEAENEGQKCISAAHQDALECSRKVLFEADQEATLITSNLSTLTHTTCQTLRQDADKKIHQAVQLVVESLVDR